MKTRLYLILVSVFGFALTAGLPSQAISSNTSALFCTNPCDCDGDGYYSISCEGDDCNDLNSNIHPGATEICDNRRDDDCDGDTDFAAQRAQCESMGWVWFAATCSCSPSTPIIIDLLGNGYQLTDAQSGVNFDINDDGHADHLSWTAAGTDDAFLAFDRNGNGLIDSGAELFGNTAAQPPSDEPNGFIALAEFDKLSNGGNGDGAISARDTIFDSLRLWEDSNHNGVSEPGELHTLGDFSISSIELKYRISKKQDLYGNTFRYRAKVHDLQGSVGRWAWDVVLVTQ